jgi:serine/threonine-protein kinase RsbT
MSDERRVEISHESDIVVARREGRALAAPLGFTGGELAVIATAISEVARNIVVYAKRGEVVLRLVESNGRKGIRVIAADQGQGIADLGLAMKDGYSTSRGLGLGLPGCKRLMDEFAIDSTLGKGTTVTMTKWGPR